MRQLLSVLLQVSLQRPSMSFYSRKGSTDPLTPNGFIYLLKHNVISDALIVQDRQTELAIYDKKLTKVFQIWKGSLKPRGNLRWDQVACIHHLDTVGFFTSELSFSSLLCSMPRKVKLPNGKNTSRSQIFREGFNCSAVVPLLVIGHRLGTEFSRPGSFSFHIFHILYCISI